MFVLWYSRSLSEKFLLKCWRKVLPLVTYRECYMQNIFCLGIHFKIWQQWAQVLWAHYVLGSCYSVHTCTKALVAKKIPTYQLVKPHFTKAPSHTLDHLICNHFSRKVVLQTWIFFSGQPLFSNLKKARSMVLIWSDLNPRLGASLPDVTPQGWMLLIYMDSVSHVYLTIKV